MKTTLFSVLAIGAAASVLFAADVPKELIPHPWQPSLSATASRLQRELSEATTQQSINRLSREMADLQDAELFVTYVRLYERLPAKEREELRREQTKWLTARSRHVQESIQSEGGSLAAFEANDAEAKFTDKRIQELQKRLSNYERKQP